MAEAHGRLLNLLTLSAQGAGTVSGEPQPAGGIKRLVVLLDTTVAGGTPTLNVKIQTSVNGSNWDDVAAFTEVTAASRRYIYFQSTGAAEATTEHAEADGTMTGGTIRDAGLGEMIRAKAVVAGVTPAITATVTAYANYN